MPAPKFTAEGSAVEYMPAIADKDYGKANAQELDFQLTREHPVVSLPRRSLSAELLLRLRPLRRSGLLCTAATACAAATVPWGRLPP